jgi:DNA-binding NarL/FixJ family response regulator
MGETSSQIAATLCISVKTVEFHRANLLTKMGVRNAADLVREALRHGMVMENG